MQVNNIVIIGGGSAGWMTCAAILKLCPWINVVLVESDKTKPVGVGESTLGQFNKYLAALGLEDTDWMPYCNATYKNSIQFTNFREKGTTFQYPFGKDYNHSIDEFFDLQNNKPEDYGADEFAPFMNPENCAMVKHNKEWHGNETPEGYANWTGFNSDLDRAYHLDAEKFGQFLKERICEPWAELGRFTHVIGEVRGMVKDISKGGSPSASNRTINQLGVRLSQDKKTIGVLGDLYIDCTGFHGALIEGLMGSYFHPFKDRLANDTAFFARIPYNNQEHREKWMHNVTDCEGANNGWMWTIPLWDRIGAGYCWSSRFAMESEARGEFEQWLEEKFDCDLDEVEIKKIDVKHGYRQNAWVLNVVAIGLSYGFVEPLESTSLLTTHENILRLVDVLNRRDGYVTNIERQWFNYQAQREIVGFSKFVSMHYALSKRTDNPYWKWCTQRAEYMDEGKFGEIQTTDNYERTGSSLDISTELDESLDGMNYIMAGMGMKLGSRFGATNEKWRNLQREDMMVHLNEVDDHYQTYKEEVNKFIESDDCPSHYEYLLKNVYGGVDDVEFS